MSRVWVTRAEPGAAATADRLAMLGHEPWVAPLLAVRPLPGGPISLLGVGALAFTSANGVAAFAARSTERNLPVFAVGAATGGAAWRAGFGQVISAEGDVAALAELIALRIDDLRGAVLAPGPVEAAGDLEGELTARGVEARRLAIYETAVVDPGAETAATLEGIEVVLLHSPKAARALAAWLAGSSAPGLTGLCLSTAVAAPRVGAGLREVRAAATPTEAALLDLLPPARPPP